MEKPMSSFTVAVYKFSSRGIFWIPIYLGCFFTFVLPLGYLWNCLIGIVVGIASIFLIPFIALAIPFIGLLLPIINSILLIVSIIICATKENLYGIIVSSLLLLVNLFRTVMGAHLAKKYPRQTVLMDAEYQRRR